jgi:uncharacterized protein (TIGR00369 family)
MNDIPMTSSLTELTSNMPDGLSPKKEPDRQVAYERFLKEFGAFIPFAFYLGFELEQFEGGQSVLAYTPTEDHFNSHHVTHGGALMTLMDVSMACAARSVDPNFRVVTIEMKSTFFSPASGQLKAKGHLLHRTTKMAYVESKVYDAQQILCAHATGTFRYVSPR